MSALIPEPVAMQISKELFRSSNALDLREHVSSMWDIVVRLDAKVDDLETTVKQQQAKIKTLEARYNNENWRTPDE